MRDRARKPSGDRGEVLRALCQRLCGKLRRVVIIALYQKHILPVVPAHASRNGGRVGRIDSRNNGIEPQILQLRFIPLRVISVLLRQLRIHALVKAVAVGERLLRQDGIVRLKTQRERPEFVRQMFRFQKRVIADRLRFPAVALTVDARERIGDEGIFQELARVAARDRAGILLAVRDSDHAAAAGDSAGRVLRPALEPGADNAADRLTVAAGLDIAGNGQVIDLSRLANFEEQPGSRALSADSKPADGISVAAERAAEAGDGEKLVPSSEMSASSSTVLSTDHVSSVQFLQRRTVTPRSTQLRSE